MPETKLVHVIDDDEAMRDSLLFLLASADLPAVSYQTADSFLREFDGSAGGCVITDVRMPGMHGIDLVRHLQDRDATLPVIVITGHGDIPLAVEAMKAGAFDFLEKPFSDDRLLATVQNALDARATSTQRRAELIAVQQSFALLTARERQVLDGLMAGHPNKTIAYNLGISSRTVEIYRANVMTKLGAGSLSELVRMALMIERSDARP